MLKKSQLFTIFCLLFIFGILIANFFDFNFDVFYLFVILLFCLVLSTLLNILPKAGSRSDLTGSILFWRNKKVGLVFLGITFLFLGVWRFGLSLPNINENHIGYYNNQKIEFIGQVVDEPDIRNKHRKLTLGKIEFVETPRWGVSDNQTTRHPNGAGERHPSGVSLQGKILVNAPNYPEINYGDWLKINCLIEKPDKIEDFDYGKFLAVKDIYSVCYGPDKIQLVETRHALSLQNYNQSNWQKFRFQILKIKYKYKEIINQSVSYPQSEILSAMILGLRRGIPENILENFRQAGLSHIIAISGLHISIISLLLMNSFIAIGFRRKYAF